MISYPKLQNPSKSAQSLLGKVNYYIDKESPKIAEKYLEHKKEIVECKFTRVKGFPENKTAAKKGGKIAGYARIVFEKESGNKVISNENYLPEKKTSKLKEKKD